MLFRVGDEGFNNLWSTLISSALDAPPFYSELNKLYQQEYCADRTFTDVSFLICDRDIPRIGIACSVSKLVDGTYELSSYGRHLFILRNSFMPPFEETKLEKLLCCEIERIIHDLNVTLINFRDFLSDGNCSYLTHHLMGKGATATPRFTCLLDLTLSCEELHRNLRKRYKSFINWGLKNLILKIYEFHSIGWLEVDACRNLHTEVAGRVTRNLKTWEVQYQMILNKEAFLIAGDWQGELVTFGFFLYSPNYCYYGSSASKRELFDKPIFHALVWEAILFAKKLGCKYFETGDIIYPHNESVTKKEIDIGNFKKGFGGNIKVQLDVSWYKN